MTNRRGWFWRCVGAWLTGWWIGWLGVPMASVTAATVTAATVTATTVTATTVTPSSPAATLDALLANIRAEHEREREVYRQREATFAQAQQAQQQLLDKARADYYLTQARNNPDRQAVEANAAAIAVLQQELSRRVGEMGDVYSVQRQFVSDMQTALDASLIGAQFPQRQATLARLAETETLPTIDDMQALWYLVQQEMTESGKVVRYAGSVASAEGHAQPAEVVRIGQWSAFSGEQFLRYVPETHELIAPRQQPARALVQQAAAFSAATNGVQLAPVDPTRGHLLGLLARSPTLLERIQMGGMVGYLTIAVGIIGLGITLCRAIYLWLVRQRVQWQVVHADVPRANNPLGRILQRVLAAQQQDEETVQYTLDEAILREIPRLEYGHSVIKLFAAIGPMLGLLGTVTGMIKTFETISLYGGGDPKLMAAGISEALVCTVLGLLVAVPLLFGHNLVTSLAKDLVARLDEQSAGVLLRHLSALPVKSK